MVLHINIWDWFQLISMTKLLEDIIMFSFRRLNSNLFHLLELHLHCKLWGLINLFQFTLPLYGSILRINNSMYLLIWKLINLTSLSLQLVMVQALSSIHWKISLIMIFYFLIKHGVVILHLRLGINNGSSKTIHLLLEDVYLKNYSLINTQWEQLHNNVLLQWGLNIITW